MNLFLNNNFINTYGQLVDVSQLLRQIADEDDVIISEMTAILQSEMSYPGDFDQGLETGDIEFARLADDILYVNGDALKVIFENLLPGDYTAVVTAIANQIDNPTSATIRLDHNGVPVEEAVSPYVLPLNPEIAEVQPQQPFPEEAEVLQSRVVEVNTAGLGELKFNGHNIRTEFSLETNGVVFDVESLYRAIYGQAHDPEYIQNIVLTNREVLRPSDVYTSFGRVYLSIDALTKLHQHLAFQVEWLSMVATVTNAYADNPHENVYFNLLGHQVD